MSKLKSKARSVPMPRGGLFGDPPLYIWVSPHITTGAPRLLLGHSSMEWKLRPLVQPPAGQCLLVRQRAPCSRSPARPSQGTEDKVTPRLACRPLVSTPPRWPHRQPRSPSLALPSLLWPSFASWNTSHLSPPYKDLCVPSSHPLEHSLQFFPGSFPPFTQAFAL